MRVSVRFGWGVSLGSGSGPFAGGRLAVAEAPGVVAGLEDVAVVGQSIQQGRGHLGVIEHLSPFAEREVGGDDQAGAFVEFADQMEQQGAPSRREWQVAQFIKDHQIGISQAQGDASGLAFRLLLLQRVDQFDGRQEADPMAVAADRLDADRRRQVSLAGTRPTDQHDVLGRVDEVAQVQALHQHISFRHVSKRVNLPEICRHLVLAENAQIGGLEWESYIAAPSLDHSLVGPD